MKKNLTKIALCALLGILVFGFAAEGVKALTLKENDDSARAKYQETKGQYLKEVNGYKATRNQLLAAKEKYSKAKNAENKTAYEEKARLYLEKTVDVLIKKLEALKNWVTNRRGIPEAEKQAINSEIDQDINWLKEKKTSIPDASPEQIKEKAKELRQYWKDHQVAMKRIIAQVWSSRISGSIEKFENVSVRISQKITELKAAGKDTAQLEAWLVELNQKISLAKEKRDSAKAKYMEILSLSDADQLFKQARQFINEANSYLKEAHKKLVNIVKEMKRLGAALPPATSTENEATGTEATD